ncbi:MAG: LysE family translocator [Rhodobacteraceae bacterium]|nr:LysE family translocator [Paracoccaceae bacterium]
MIPEIITTLFAIFIINILGWLTPGPNMLVIISAATNQGRRSGFATALGVSFGGFIWVVLAVSGVTVVFELFPNMVFALRILGAGYLLWLGYKSFQAARVADEILPAQTSPVSNRAAFRLGLLVTMTNPKAAIFFSSILTAFVPVNAPLWMLMVIVIFSVVHIVLLHFITASLFSTIRVRKWFQNTRRGMQRLFGTVYIALGLGVAFDAYKRL